MLRLYSVLTLLSLISLSAACNPDPLPAAFLIVNSSAASDTPNGSECQPFLSLSPALKALNLAGGGNILIHPASSHYVIPSESISVRVTLKGSGSKLRLEGVMRVGKEGNVTIEEAEIEGDGGIETEGSLALLTTEIRNLPLGIISLGGKVKLQNCKVTLFQSPFLHISDQYSAVNITNCTYIGNSGSFIIADKAASGHLNIQITASYFQNNTVPALMPLTNYKRNLIVVIWVLDSQFLNNTGNVIDALVDSADIKLHSCVFQENYIGLLLEATTAYIQVSNCTLNRGLGALLTTVFYEGKALVEQLEVSDHRGKGLISASNLGRADTCSLQIANLTYINTTYFAQGQFAGVLHAKNCSATLSNIYISNVSIGGYFGSYYAFFDIQQASMQLDSLTISDSVSNQVYFFLFLSSVRASNLSFTSVGSGLNSIIAASMCPSLHFSNFLVYNATSVSSSDSVSIALPEFIYFVLTLCDAKFVNISVILGTSKCIFCTVYGSSDVVGLTVNNVSVGLGILTTLGSVHTSQGMKVQGGNYVAIWSLGTKASVHVFDAHLQSASIDSILICGYLSTCYITNLRLTEVSGNRLVLGGHISYADIGGLIITNSQIRNAVYSIVDAFVSISNATLSNSVLTLASLHRSRFLLANSSMYIGGNARTPSDFMSGLQSTIQLTRVRIEGLVRFPGLLGKFSEHSQLHLIDSQLFNISKTDGFKLTDSAIFITNCKIAHFYFTLVEARGGNVTLSKSVFTYGGSTDSAIAQQGGLVSCRSCSITIRNIQAFHLKAPKGGAIAAELSTLNVIESWFEDCAAEKGGAMALTESTYVIHRSNFTNCNATTRGGAIEVGSSRGNSIISHCFFSGNTAKEGGSVKFDKEVGRFVQVIFDKNIADYGPDYASYGVSARVSLDFSQNVEFLSGNELPSPLNIEILDHFGKIVRSDSRSQLVFEQNNGIRYGGLISLISKEGVFHLMSVPFFAIPNTTQTLIAVISLPYTTFILPLELRFRACEKGEIALSDRCIICSPGTYSFTQTDKECSLCPLRVTCPGKDAFQVNSGLWRSSQISTEIHSCPLASVCKGGQNSSCAEGYNGKMCTECEKGWYRVGTLYCEKCSDPSVFIQIGAYVIQFVAVYWLAVRLARHLTNEKLLIALFMWVEHTQYSIVFLRLKVEAPTLLYYVYRVIAFSGSLSVASLPLACIFPYPSLYTQPYFLYSLSFLVLLPSFWRALCARSIRTELLNRWLLVSFLTGPAYVEVLASLFISFEYEDSRRWLYADASIELLSERNLAYLKLLIAPVTAAMLAIPLTLSLLILLIFRHKKTVIVESFLQRGLTKGYFGIIGHIWKLIFVFTVIAITDFKPLFQVSSSFALLIAYLVFTVALRPYLHEPYLLLLSIMSKLTVYVGLSISGYYAFRSSVEPVSGTLFGIFVIALHIVLFLQILHYLKHKETVDPVIPKARTTVPLAIIADMTTGDLFVPHNSIAQ